MSYMNIEKFLTEIWLQMCSTENVGLGARSVPVLIYSLVSKMVTCKEKSKEHQKDSHNEETRLPTSGKVLHFKSC